MTQNINKPQPNLSIFQNVFATQTELIIKNLVRQQETLQYKSQQLKKIIHQKFRLYDQAIQSYKQRTMLQLKKFQQELENQQQTPTLQQSSNITKDRNLISLKNLANYLQKQKLYIKNEVLNNQDNKNVSILHKTLARKRFQQILNRLKVKRIQQQIKFLENNILTSNTVFFDITPPSHQQQTQLKKQLENQLEQLERLVGLKITCSKSLNNQTKVKLQNLKNQSQRLKEVSKLLEQQRKSISQIKNLITLLSAHCQKLISPPTLSKKIQNKQILSQRINLQQIQELMNINIPTNINSIASNKLQIANKIQILKKRVRKIEVWGASQ